MGRTTERIVLTKTQRESITVKRDAFAKAGKARYADRCRAVELCADEWELNEIVAAVKRPYSTVQRWLREFRRKGLRSLEHKPRPGRPRELDDHQRMLLDKAIERGPRACGYHGAVWTSPMVADHIQKRFGVEYHPGHVRKLLHDLGYSLQYPRSKLALADHEAQGRWLKRTYPRIKKKPGSGEP
ncbi:MAG: IS630 family transposase [Candidatus Methylomirabilaceae bacterium]